jgi:hypothetical protein
MRILDLVALAGLTAVPSSADDPLPPPPSGEEQVKAHL